MTSSMKFSVIGVVALMLGLIWFSAPNPVEAANDTTVSASNELIDPKC